MIVGVCKLSVHLPTCHSLKEKRGLLRKVKARTFNKFKIPVSEVGGLDKWQLSELGFSITGNDSRLIEGLIQNISDYIESLGLVMIMDEYRELLSV